MYQNTKPTFILTVYTIDLNGITHMVTYIHEITNSCNDKYSLLKYNKQNVTDILYKHAQLLYNEILSNFDTIDSCPIIEICRHICDSVNVAKKIADNVGRVFNNRDVSFKYMCHKCKLYVNTESHWIRHLLTATHNDRINMTENDLFNCRNCGKYFLSRSYLWKHNKTCKEIPKQTLRNIQHHFLYDIFNSNNEHVTQPVEHVTQPDATITKQDIINELTAIIREQNNAVFDKIIELCRPAISANINGNYNTTNNTNNTNCTNHITNNNHFNLNFFLNETCKNAITIKEFIENIHVGVETVEYTGRHGYVAGISKIITDELNKLGFQMRPIHCTDLKRETMYIKDDNGWEKDNEEKKLLNNTIQSIVRKNMKQINQWRIENPNCEINDSTEYNFEIDIMKECMGDFNSEKMDNKRICNQIAKNTYRELTALRASLP